MMLKCRCLVLSLWHAFSFLCSLLKNLTLSKLVYIFTHVGVCHSNRIPGRHYFFFFFFHFQFNPVERSSGVDRDESLIDLLQGRELTLLVNRSVKSKNRGKKERKTNRNDHPPYSLIVHGLCRGDDVY